MKFGLETTKNKWTLIFIFALIIAGGISLLASSNPDGLESSAEFIGLHWPEASFASLMPDYQILGISNEFLSASLAGILGTIIIYLLVLLIIKITNKKQKNLPPT